MKELQASSTTVVPADGNFTARRKVLDLFFLPAEQQKGYLKEIYANCSASGQLNLLFRSAQEELVKDIVTNMNPNLPSKRIATSASVRDAMQFLEDYVPKQAQVSGSSYPAQDNDQQLRRGRQEPQAPNPASVEASPPAESKRAAPEEEIVIPKKERSQSFATQTNSPVVVESALQKGQKMVRFSERPPMVFEFANKVPGPQESSLSDSEGKNVEDPSVQYGDLADVEKKQDINDGPVVAEAARDFSTQTDDSVGVEVARSIETQTDTQLVEREVKGVSNRADNPVAAVRPRKAGVRSTNKGKVISGPAQHSQPFFVGGNSSRFSVRSYDPSSRVTRVVKN